MLTSAAVQLARRDLRTESVSRGPVNDGPWSTEKESFQGIFQPEIQHLPALKLACMVDHVLMAEVVTAMP
ncbi:unnamed protein product [Boreogadus saida]